MECPSCKVLISQSQQHDSFCSRCGRKFPDEFKAEMANSFGQQSEASMTHDPGRSVLDEEKNNPSDHPIGVGPPGMQQESPIDVQEVYRNAVEEVLRGSRITTDRVLYLVRKKKELGLEDNEAIAL
jgi:hypothetical protein